MHILLDSGSSVSIINSKFFKDEDIQILPYKVTVTGVNNHSTLLKGTASIQIKFSEIPTPIKFNVYVMENFKFDLLLGMDFIHHKAVDLQFSKGRVIIQDYILNLLPISFQNDINSVPIAVNSVDISIPVSSNVTVPIPVSRNVSNIRAQDKQEPTVPWSVIPPGGIPYKIIPSFKSQDNFTAISTKEIVPYKTKIPHAYIHLLNEISFTAHETNIVDETTIIPLENTVIITSIEQHIKNILARINPHAQEEDRLKMSALLSDFQDVFSKDGEIGLINCYKHTIKLEPGAKPVRRPPYRKPPHLEEFERKKVEELLSMGIIRPSSSPWSMGVVVVEKGHKKDGVVTPRMTIDMRPLNKVTIADNFPIWNMQSVKEWVGSRSKFISTMDVHKGFWGLPISEESIPLTAFITSTGLYEWTSLPMGVKNGSAAYQRAISIVLKGLLWKNILNFIDDIFAADNSIDEHISNLKLAFERFRKHGVKLSIEKSNFLKNRAFILGSIISSKGEESDPVKIKAVQEILPPKNVNELQKFLGCCGWFRKFIRGYSYLAKNLTKLTRKNVPWDWSTEQDIAFQDLKNALTTYPVLIFFDDKKPIHIYTDSSGFGIAAALLQPNELGAEQAVAFFSKTLNSAESRYSTPEREFYAIFHALKAFHCYISGRKFIIFTDHKPFVGIKFASNTTKISSRLSNWALLLQEHDCIIKHNKGSQHQLADGLSRLPLPISEHEATLDFPCNNIDILFLKEMQLLDTECILLKTKIAEPNISRSFSINDGLLVNKSAGYARPVIPKSMRQNILTEFHSIPISGHLGFSRTYSKIQLRMYWRTMKTDLFNFISSCESCLSQKRHYGKSHGQLHPIPCPDYPFEFVSTDVVGPFPLSQSNNRYIVNAICLFSKWAEVRAIPDQTGPTIAKFLEEQVFCRHSCPKFLLSDNGPCYISKVLADHNKLYGVKAKFITPYNSKSNGLSERLHQTFSKMISHYVNERHDNWDEKLFQLQWAYNTTIQKSTNISPYKLVYNMEAVFPTQYNLPGGICDASSEDLAGLRENIKKILSKEQQRYKEREDKKRKKVAFDIGDLVMLKFPKKVKQGQSMKLVPFFLGRYMVVKKINDLAYEVENVHTKAITKTHVQRMRKIGHAYIYDEDILTFGSESDLIQDLQNPTEMFATVQTLGIELNPANPFHSSYLPFAVHVFQEWDDAVIAYTKSNKLNSVVFLDCVPTPLPKLQVFHVPNLILSEISSFHSQFKGKNLLLIGRAAWEFVFLMEIFYSKSKLLFPSLINLLVELSQNFDLQKPSFCKLCETAVGLFPMNELIEEDSDSDIEEQRQNPNYSSPRSKRVKFKPLWHSDYVF